MKRLLVGLALGMASLSVQAEVSTPCEVTPNIYSDPMFGRSKALAGYTDNVSVIVCSTGDTLCAESVALDMAEYYWKGRTMATIGQHLDDPYVIGSIISNDAMGQGGDYPVYLARAFEMGYKGE